MLTYSVLWWQVNGVCVQVLQESAIHQKGELLDLDGVPIPLVQQFPEMFTPAMANRRVVAEAGSENRPSAHRTK